MVVANALRFRECRGSLPSAWASDAAERRPDRVPGRRYATIMPAAVEAVRRPCDPRSGARRRVLEHRRHRRRRCVVRQRAATSVRRANHMRSSRRNNRSRVATKRIVVAPVAIVVSVVVPADSGACSPAARTPTRPLQPEDDDRRDQHCGLSAGRGVRPERHARPMRRSRPAERRPVGGVLASDDVDPAHHRRDTEHDLRAEGGVDRDRMPATIPGALAPARASTQQQRHHHPRPPPVNEMDHRRIGDHQCGPSGFVPITSPGKKPVRSSAAIRW